MLVSANRQHQINCGVREGIQLIHHFGESRNITVVVFEWLQKEADIVLLAGPAISRFAESLPSASRVNAIILVARSTEARSKVVNKVVEDLRLMKINLAGVIFDYNSWPFVSAADRRAGSVLEPRTTTEARAQQSNLSEQTTKS